MTTPISPPVYVVDTHTLWWYLTEDSNLSPAAAQIFELAHEGQATIVVPAIVVAEFYYTSVKLQQPYTPSDLVRAINSRANIETADLGMVQLEMLDKLLDVPEMHDRLIAAEVVLRGGVLVTRDRAIAASTVPTLW